MKSLHILSALTLGVLLSASASAGLVAHFDFEEGAGTTTASTVGGWTGTFSGSPDWVTTGLAPIPGGTTAAIEFDGNVEHIRTDYAGIAGSADRTVALWMKADTSSDGAFVAWGNSDSPNGRKWHVRVNDGATDGIDGAVRTEIQGSFEIGSPDLLDGEWHHVASVYDAGGAFGSGQVRHYIDGVLVALSGDGDDGITVNTATTSTYAGGSSDFTPVWLGGRRQSDSTRGFAGLMDDVRVYDHALTASEISALVNGVSVPEPASLALVGLGLFGLALRRRRK